MDDTTRPAPTDTRDPGDHETVRLDSAGLHALAHPLRLRLLGALRIHGPATATQLARRLDTNSGQTSYHLRKLAEVDLIQEDAEHSTARDRYWRATHAGTSWSSRDFRDDPDDWAADTLLLGQLARLHGQWIDDALAARDTWDPAWLSSSDMSDWSLHLTPDTLRAMIGEVHDVIRRYRDQLAEPDAPDAERITVLLSAFPHEDPST